MPKSKSWKHGDVRVENHLQEYNPQAPDLDRDANQIIQRTLEYGTWDEVRWPFPAPTGELWNR